MFNRSAVASRVGLSEKPYEHGRYELIRESVAEWRKVRSLTKHGAPGLVDDI